MPEVVIGKISAKDNPKYRQCIDWIYTQRTEIEIAKYGKNEKSVRDAIAEQELKANMISEYRKQVDIIIEQTSSEEDRTHLENTYKELSEISDKKLNCLYTMLEIALLQDYCGNLSNEFDLRAVRMVTSDERRKLVGQKTGDQKEGFISPSARDCIFAAQDNWNWIIKLVKCIETHLKNASTYHQFFHDLDESEHFMLEDLKKLHDSYELEPINPDYNEAQRLLVELEELLVCLRQWETKANFAWDQATKVVPVHVRTSGVTSPTPIRALADYETKQISVREGEDLLLLDNSKINMWKVRNNRGQEAEVPALICLIPGPFRDAINAAVTMRLKLMAAWTNTLKRMGRRLIFFMLLVFKPRYNADEIKLMRSIRSKDKKELMRILDFVEDTLKVHWGSHEGFINLQERILALKMILNEAGDNPLEDENTYRALIVQITMLEKLMAKYKDLWRDWELYKVALETSQAPHLMLIVDKWEQLQFVTREYFTKFWQTEIGLSEEEKRMVGIGQQEEEIIEEEVEMTSASGLHSARESVDGAGDYGYATETKTAETEELASAEMEEKKTFTIKSVVDPRNESEISLQEAIMQGIINPAEGNYVNIQTAETVPIPVAMSQGLIKVEFTSTKRTQEKKSTIGIITVKTNRERARPYNIRTVKDTVTGRDLSLEDGIRKGILNEATGMYRDPKTKKTMMIFDAIHQGLVDAVYEGGPAETETVSTTYAVRAVVDTQKKTTVTFQEAINSGIIVKETGAFKDTLTGETMYVGDAIMRGFLKARVIEDTNSLDIDPSNKMVVDKTETIRRKILKPLGVISALRRAARAQELKQAADDLNNLK